MIRTVSDSYERVDIEVTCTSDAPRGEDLYYHCTLCDGLVPSQPKDCVACKCGNIYIDIGGIDRLVVRDFGAFEVVRTKK